MNLAQLFRMIWARRGLILTTTLVCFVGAMLVVLLLPPRYEATSRVLLDIMKPDPVTGEVIASTSQRTYIATQAELIKDYRTAGRVVDKLGWANAPQLAEAYRNSGSEADFRRWLAQRVIDGTTVDLAEGSNIMEIKYAGPEREAAAKVADTIREAYVEQTLASRRSGAVRSVEFFKQQSEKLGEDLRQAEQRKADFERENGIVLTGDDSDTDIEKLRTLSGVVAPSTVTTAPSAPMSSPSPLAGQLAQMDAAIATASKQLGPNHPDLIAMRQQRATLAQSVAATTVRGGGGGGVVTSGPSIQAQYAQQQARVLATRGKAAEARRLQQDVTVLRDQLQKATARYTQLEQEAATTETGLQPLGDAITPSGPSFPNYPVAIFGSLAMGLALGVLLALLLELMTRRVRGVDDLGLLDVPVVGAVG